MVENDDVFQNIDYKNKAIATPYPDKIKDIDIHDEFLDDIVEAEEDHTLDLNTLNSFTNVSRSRNEVYRLLDLMGEDPIISTALEIYAADICETNDSGQVVWCEAKDPKIIGAVNMILNNMNIDKYAYSWVYSLVKYGDLYLRLYRNSEINPEENSDKTLNEDVILNAFKKSDRYNGYVGMVKNPAEVFDLTKFGKTYGFIKTKVPAYVNPNDLEGQMNTSLLFKYNFTNTDVNIYPATEYVHASLEDNSDRTVEEVTITTDLGNDKKEYDTYGVKRGQSVLYNSFKVWRELSLLENSIMLNRLTKSSLIRLVQVEVGDMDKSQAHNLLARIKQMIEQKSAIQAGQSIKEYTNPGAIDNAIYYPVHEGKGAISTTNFGGDVNPGELTDLDYWKKKLFASLGIPGQYLGDTSDSTGFNGGTSLSLISSRYAKTIKRIQNTFCQAITDAVNLNLYDRGLTQYINKFIIRMQEPTTQEEKDRNENMDRTISTINSIMSLLGDIQEPAPRLEIIKNLLGPAINNQEVISIIQDEIDNMTAGEEPEEGESGEFGGGEDFDLGGDLGGSDFGSTELPEAGEETGGSQPLEASDLGMEEAPEEAPNESFSSGNGEELLNEESLPTFNDLGISYLDIK